jgi:hypothetical protein
MAALNYKAFLCLFLQLALLWQFMAAMETENPNWMALTEPRNINRDTAALSLKFLQIMRHLWLHMLELDFFDYFLFSSERVRTVWPLKPPQLLEYSRKIELLLWKSSRLEIRPSFKPGIFFMHARILIKGYFALKNLPYSGETLKVQEQSIARFQKLSRALISMYLPADEDKDAVEEEASANFRKSHVKFDWILLFNQIEQFIEEASQSSNELFKTGSEIVEFYASKAIESLKALEIDLLELWFHSYCQKLSLYYPFAFQPLEHQIKWIRTLINPMLPIDELFFLERPSLVDLFNHNYPILNTMVPYEQPVISLLEKYSDSWCKFLPFDVIQRLCFPMNFVACSVSLELFLLQEGQYVAIPFENIIFYDDHLFWRSTRECQQEFLTFYFKLLHLFDNILAVAMAEEDTEKIKDVLEINQQHKDGREKQLESIVTLDHSICTFIKSKLLTMELTAESKKWFASWLLFFDSLPEGHQIDVASMRRYLQLARLLLLETQ